MKLGIEIHIKGAIDVPDDWENPDDPQEVLDVAEFRYTEQLTTEDTISELARKMYKYAEETEVAFQFNREVE